MPSRELPGPTWGAKKPILMRTAPISWPRGQPRRVAAVGAKRAEQRGGGGVSKSETSSRFRAHGLGDQAGSIRAGQLAQPAHDVALHVVAHDEDAGAQLVAALVGGAVDDPAV